MAGEGAPPGGHPAAAWLAPFKTPLDCYDVVLRLRRSALAAPGRALPLPGAKRGGGAAPSDPLAPSVAAALADGALKPKPLTPSPCRPHPPTAHWGVGRRIAGLRA